MSTGHVVQSWSGEPPVDRRPAEASRACRALFGPTDREENLRFVREEVDKINNLDRERWNFDFKNEIPLSGRYEWSKVDKHSKQQVTKQTFVQTMVLEGNKDTNNPDKLYLVQSASVPSNIDTPEDHDLTRKSRQTRITDYMKKRKQPRMDLRNRDPDVGIKILRRASS
ncbi:uncharacterized protein LOC143222797 [Tachypleus tridentatus]|uniref:uncharacterized protein LOC143222797 n=1 Tax=Tachypleus tridentatus TaxID=6853 RepID=UPI003FD2BDA3